MTGASGPNPWLAGSGLHGEAYDRRFEELASLGEDVHGEASRVAALDVRSVLDAGCGTGRVAIELAHRGLEVVGVDLDPRMLDAARVKAPDLEWVQGDLATVDLGRTFDAVVMAGNVMIFLTPGTEGAVLRNAARHLGPTGLLVVGFSLGRGLVLAAYDALAAEAGFELRDRWATWAREPFDPSSGYAVSVHRLAGR